MPEWPPSHFPRFTMPLSRIFLWASLSLLAMRSLPAQTQIEGRILDEEGEPLAQAHVLLFTAADSAFVQGAFAGAGGYFHLEGLSPGTYYGQIRMVGYPTWQSDRFALRPEPGTLAWGDIQLSGAAGLDAVEITDRKAIIEQRPDMLVVNVAAMATAAGLNGLDLLRQAPGVRVDMDENIQLLGKDGVQILINGQPTRLSGSDLATLLKTMNADNIEAIEVIANPPARYDAEGNGGIINLRLKKNPALGFNGNVITNFSQGSYARHSQSLTLNYGGERLRTRLTLTRSEENRPDYFLDTKQQNGFVLDFDSRELKQQDGYNLGFELEAPLAERHSLSFSTQAIFNEHDNALNSRTGIARAGAPGVEQWLVSQTLLDQTFRNYTGNLHYLWAIDSSARLSSDLSLGRFTTQGYTQQPNTFLAADTMTVLRLSNNAFDTGTGIDLWSALADFEKSWPQLTLAAGGKWAAINTDNRFAFFSLQPDGPVADLARSNDFSYTERVAAAYANLEAQLGDKFTARAGLRMEHTASRGLLESRQNIEDTDVRRRYTDFFPNLGLSFNHGLIHALSLSVGRRITRPNYQNLNPFESPLSELTAWKGNPFLQPSYTINYQATYTFRQRLNLTQQYSVTRDFFATIFEISGENSNLIIPRNMERATRYSFALSYPQRVWDFWEFTTFLNAGRSTFAGDLAGTVIDLAVTTWSVRVQNNLRLPGGILLDVAYERYSDWIWRGSIEVRGNHRLDLGLRKDFLDQRLQLRLTGADVLRTDSDYVYQGEYGGIVIHGVRTFDNRRWGAGLTWNFGNQAVKAAKRTRNAMQEELRRLQSTD